MTGWWMVLGAVAIAIALGLLHRFQQGRITRTAGTATLPGDAVELTTDRRADLGSGEQPTNGGRAPGYGLPEQIRAAVYGADTSSPDRDVVLLQLSTTFCAPCRHAKVILSGLADETPGLRHVEFDLTPTPEIATELRVLRTPTTLALDPDGRELFRLYGVPKRDRLLAELEPHLDRAR